VTLWRFSQEVHAGLVEIAGRGGRLGILRFGGSSQDIRGGECEMDWPTGCRCV